MPAVISAHVHQLARYHDRYEVRVACPAEQQSAQSHAVTIFKPLWAEPYAFHSDLAHVPAYKVSGTPTDCVKVALMSDLLGGWQPDLVISGMRALRATHDTHDTTRHTRHTRLWLNAMVGINAGQNDGLNVIYSGTCAAALEASMYDIPSIALSLEYNFAIGGSLATPHHISLHIYRNIYIFSIKVVLRTLPLHTTPFQVCGATRSVRPWLFPLSVHTLSLMFSFSSFSSFSSSL
jgi:hypothetical protein